MIDVYCHTNRINKKSYVGQSCYGITARWKDHCKDAEKDNGFYFANAIKKYGPEAFDHILIEQCSIQQDADEVEDFCIEYLNSMAPNGYNLKGDGAAGKVCAESRRRGGEKIKKRFEDPEFKRKHREATIAGSNKPEAIAKNSEQGKKRFEDPEERRKNSERTKKQFEDPDARLRHSEAQSIASKEQWSDPRTRRKASESQKIAQNRPETNAKRSASLKGHIVTCSICHQSGHNKATCGSK